MTTEQYVVYVLDDNDDIYDTCGEFNTLEDAREYRKYQEARRGRLLLNDKYAIYLRNEIKIE